MLKQLIEKLNGKYEDREIVVAMSYGSHNYGTNDETSDRDYKIFVLPTKNDLYDGKSFNSQVKIDGNDVEIHDIRKMAELTAKANPAYVEIYNPNEKYINPKFNEFGEWLFSESTARALCNANRASYIAGVDGMIKQKIKAIEKDLPNEETNEGYKRKLLFGFDSKQLVHIIRLSYIKKNVIDGVNPYDLVILPKDFADELIKIKKNTDGETKDRALIRANDLDKIKYEKKEFAIDAMALDTLRKEIKNLVLNNL